MIDVGRISTENTYVFSVEKLFILIKKMFFKKIIF